MSSRRHLYVPLPGVEDVQKFRNGFFAIARNRKLHFLLASLAFFFALFHGISSQGVRLDVATEKNRLFAYDTAQEIVSMNLVVSDIHIQKCLRGFACPPPTLTSSPSAFWERIPAKLNLFAESYQPFNYYMYIEKSPIAEAERFVVDLTFTQTPENPDVAIENAQVASHKIWGKGYLWLHYHDVADFNVPIVRDVNVFFGSDDMKDSRKHWRFNPNKLPLPGKHSIDVKISMLAVAVVDEIRILQTEQDFDTILKKNEILTTTNPKFKIMQLSDLHIGQDTGACFEECKSDAQTIEFVKTALEKEGDVSLVMITGDMIDFRRTKHHESVILRALSPILEAHVPFVFVFGDTDYDARDYLTKESVLNFVASLPGCYNKKVDDLDHRLHGLSNGNLKVYYATEDLKGEKTKLETLAGQKASAIVTYLDSEGKNVRDSQANYVYRINHKPSSATDQKLMFIHYPLPNFRPQGAVKLIGNYNEKHELITKTDRKFLEDVKTSKYKVVAVGHEHENDACIWEESAGNQVLLCYSGVAGQSGQTRLDPAYERRVRVFELDFENNKIFSWKRDKAASLDPQEIWSAEASG